MSNCAAFASRKRLLDLFEQIAVVALFSWMVARLWPEDFFGAHWYSLLILASEGLVVALLLMRRPTEKISNSPYDWAVGMGGTFLALLVVPGGEPVHAVLGAMFLLSGFAMQLGAKLSLWRSFGVVAANRGVKTVGLYRLVRHPMYAGYLLTHAGFLLLTWSWWNFTLYVTVWMLLALRIKAEESVLRQDPAYAAYTQHVRARIVPGIY